METDREEDAGAVAGNGGGFLAFPEGDSFVQGTRPHGAELSLRTLATALARVMDVLPAELVLCTPAGSILHTNHAARKLLEAGEARKSIEEEIRFLCVGLHLQISEEAGRDESEYVPQAERRVMLDGGEVHLRAVDLGVPRHGRSPATLILLDSRNPLSDRDLEQAGLTRAEIRIARLVMRGGTNREIAVALSVSVHTVRHHVQHILDKVGVRSRTRLMATLSTQRQPIAAP
ncbi:MAG TPA: LuxR C-terminal-related transcriptional regulator [Longimicrobium sp.]|nr:LuxR C-terminal-related transcriptional regulator [Longimicrobium sp.]